MKLGLFGGTFDPVHRGHVETVRRAMEAAGLDRVLFLPTAVPPHKEGREGAGPWARFAMVELALLDEPGLFASSHELTPGRAAYTVETLEHFRRERPDDGLHLLLGSDSVADLPSWRRPLDLVRLARLVILVRPGWEIDAVRRSLPAELAAALWGQSGTGAPEPPVVVEHRVPVAATDIRRALARGEDPARDALHPRVLHYVRKYHLYR